MKTYSLRSNTRIWTSRLVAVGLGLTGLSCLAATPAPPEDKFAANPASSANNGQGWDGQVFDQMKHIQQEMDDLFRDTQRDLTFGGPRFDASATIQDQGNDYVASFYLPKRDLAHVKVNVKDDVLVVSASAEQTIKGNGNANATNGAGTDSKGNSNAAPASETEMLNEYEQLVSLPGPVDASKMKIDKHGDTLTVTIPKKEGNQGKTASVK